MIYHDFIACIFSGILGNYHSDKFDHFETNKKHLKNLNIPGSDMVALYKAYVREPEDQTSQRHNRSLHISQP